MLPNNSLSTSLAIGTFVPPDELYDWCKKLVDYEEGGIALNDPSQGMRVRAWRIVAKDREITIDVPAAPEITPVLLYTAASRLTEISLAFDQNMAPALAFVEGGVAKFWYFATDTQSRQTLELTGCTAPRCFLDDKRSTQTGNSDIILVYLKAGGLYYRQQRDRYLTERLLKMTDAVGINRCGMTYGNRVQIELVFGEDYPVPSLCLFGSIEDAIPDSVYESEIVALDQWVPVDTQASVTNGELRYRMNTYAAWGAWGTAPVAVAAGGHLQARGTAQRAFDALRNVRIAIGDLTCNFPITTFECLNTTNFLVFTDLTGKAKGVQFTSEVVTAHECLLPNAPVSITAGEYRINGGTWTSSNGIMQPADTVQMRVLSSSEFETQVCATLTVDTYSGTFCVTTLAEGDCEAEYVRPEFDAAHANFTESYTRPSNDQAGTDFPPICE